MANSKKQTAAPGKGKGKGNQTPATPPQGGLKAWFYNVFTSQAALPADSKKLLTDLQIATQLVAAFGPRKAFVPVATAGVGRVRAWRGAYNHGQCSPGSKLGVRHHATSTPPTVLSVGHAVPATAAPATKTA